MTRRRALIAALLCIALFAAGIAAVIIGMQDRPPEPTPTPSADSSLSPEDARKIPRPAADKPVTIPDGDHGPYVRTKAVDKQWTDLVDSPDSTGNGATSASKPPSNYLAIPSLYVQARVVSEGVSEGSMLLPNDLRTVGHLRSTASLGAKEGTSLVAGHVTHGGTPGALFLLGMVKPGASVVTTDAKGKPTTWVVNAVKSYRKTALPDNIFRADGPRQLAIVTCGGRVIRTNDGRYTHEDNIVVTAVPR
ncbi:class F sortase [Demetria terragena]|uniref:class F sortase n=1 Tax=Demetria terragena TaxID=63959 RepID=UPI0003623108|nr:class F sortase [Demetria terragena]